MRTIAELLNLDGRVYVYVPSKNIRRLFLKNAQKEGFMFADGVNPTKRRAYDDMAARCSSCALAVPYGETR